LRLATLACALGCALAACAPGATGPARDDVDAGRMATGGRGGAGGTPPGAGGETPGAGGETPGAGGTVEIPARDLCQGVTGEVPGPRLLRRLTAEELDATVRAAFALAPAEWAGPALPPDPAAGNGFTNNADRLLVGDGYARALLDTAKAVATAVTADAKLAVLVPCAAQGDAACASTFVDTYGARLFRRPLAVAEKARYTALLGTIRAGQGDFKAWVTWATVALVQSPHTLYRSELGEASGGAFALTPYETASALAYTFTGGPPTPALMQAAASNTLATPDQLEAAARALAFDGSGQPRPAFRAILLRFASQWLGLSPLANLAKDEDAVPGFDAGVQAALAEETTRLFAEVVFAGKGRPADLLTAPYTFVDPTLAGYYGFGAGGGGFTRVQRPDGWGVGILAQGSVMAVQAGGLSTSPTKRGHLVRSRLLCADVPPPPKFAGDVPEPTGAETTRQRYETLHARQPACSTCHRLMDPIGFAFEHLDAGGRYREDEGGLAIDVRGTIADTSAGDLSFDGPTALAAALAKLPETSDCMASFLASYAFGLDDHDVACTVRTAAAELRAGKIGVADFYVRLARAPHFRTRN
jgi:hypothetical protein